MLDAFPLEVFGRVCRYLEPKWLDNLSKSCAAMRVRLSSDRGNLIWYRTMPASIWPDRARYPSPPQPSQLPGLLLGGPYEPTYDYRREIIGRPPTQWRCDICLTQRRYGSAKAWNITFCQNCLEDYTICKFSDRSFLTSCKLIYIIAVWEVKYLRVPAADAALPHLAHSICSVRGMRRVYRPEIDEIIKNTTGLDSQTVKLVNRKQEQMRRRLRLERSEDEHVRRTARRKIVEYARLIWEGEDPVPNKIYSSSSGDVFETVPRLGMPGANTFRWFRDRFAPTVKLHEFLFPDDTLNDNPTQLPYDPYDPQRYKRWLKDPTTILTRDSSTVEDDQWYAEQALEMLKHLSSWNTPDYYASGSGKPTLGGSVATWVNAAKDYHVQRLEKELETGVTATLSHTPVELHRTRLFHRIRELRYQCGLQARSARRMTRLPKSLKLEACMAKGSIARFFSRQQKIEEAERARSQRVKIFNKIVRVASKRCPVCTEIHQSVRSYRHAGLEWIVDLVRKRHPNSFWTLDDWHTVG